MSTLDARAPLAETRREQLLEALRRAGTVRVSELTEVLGVTPVTVRRDIAQLARDGLVRRVHGGATLPRTATGPATGAPLAEASPGDTGAAAAEDAGTRCVGFVVPSLDYYWPEVVRGAEEAAAALGVRVVLRASSYDSDDERPHLERLLEQEGLEGVLVAPRVEAPTFGRTLEWLVGTDVPLVLVERSATTGQHAAVVESVVSDHALGAGMALRHLTGLGHRRVALLLSEHSPTSTHLRRGWHAAAEDQGLARADVLERWVPDARSSRLETVLEEAVDACLAAGTTAVLVHADAEAMAFVQRLEARGLVVPRDLSVMAYDDEVASLFHPALSAVRPPRRSIGRAAVELLVARVQDRARPTHRVVVSPSLNVRASTSGAPR